MNWHSVPFLRLLIPFSIGIILGKYNIISLKISLTLMVTALLFIVIFEFFAAKNWHIKLRYRHSIYLQLLCILSAIILTHFHNELEHNDHFANKTDSKNYILEIYSIQKNNDSSISCYAKTIVSKSKNDKLSKTKGNIAISIKNPSNKIQIGDTIVTFRSPSLVKGPKAPWEFDYKSYLENKKIYHQLYLKPNQYSLITSNSQSIKKYAYICKTRIATHIQSIFKSNSRAGFVEALLIGEKQNLDKEQVEQFSQTGTLHVLAVSGLHVGLIFTFLILLTKGFKFSKYHKRIEFLIIIIGLWTYAFVTGLSTSVIRASLMISTMTLANQIGRKNNSINSIAISAFILLILNPLHLFEVGFQLSYLAVTGIVYSQKLIQKLPKMKYKALNYVTSLACITIVAQLFTFPVSIYHFHQFPTYFLIANLAVLPLISLLMYGLIVNLIFSFVPIVGPILCQWNTKIIDSINSITNIVSRFEYSSIQGIQIGLMSIVLIYIVILTITENIKKFSKTSFIISLILINTIIIFEQVGHLRGKQEANIYDYSTKKHRLIIGIRNRELYVFEDKKTSKIDDLEKIRNRIVKYKKIDTIEYIDLSKNTEKEHIKNKVGFGFQFFDRIMTD